MFLDGSEDLVGLDLEDIESDSLGKGSALSDGDNITFMDSLESRGAVSRDVGVSLLISVIFLNIVEIVSSNDNSSVHFSRDAHSLENSSSDGDITGEGAFLVNIVSLYGIGGGIESKSYFLEISHGIHFS